MRGLALGEGERSLEVVSEERGLLDGSEELGVDGLLVLLALVEPLGVDLLLEVEKALLTLLGGSDAGEVLVVDVLGDLDTADVNLCGGANNVGLVDAAEGAAVALVRACYGLSNSHRR